MGNVPEKRVNWKSSIHRVPKKAQYIVHLKCPGKVQHIVHHLNLKLKKKI